MTDKWIDERGQVKDIFTMREFNRGRYIYRTWTMGAMLSMLSIFILLALGQPNGVLVIFIILAFGMCAYWNAGVRLVVREKGVETHYTPFEEGKFAAWGNLSHIKIDAKPTPGEGEGTEFHQVLVLKDSFQEIDIHDFINMPISSHSTGSFLSKRSYPFIDAYSFPKTGLGIYIQMYAPHIVELLRQEQTKIESLP